MLVNILWDDEPELINDPAVLFEKNEKLLMILLEAVLCDRIRRQFFDLL